jgi:hypothetical protein
MLEKLKGAWRSVTVWFNGALLAMLPVYEVVKESLPEIQSYLPDNVYKWVGIAVVMLNIALRFKTNSDLAHK